MNNLYLYRSSFLSTLAMSLLLGLAAVSAMAQSDPVPATPPPVTPPDVIPPTQPVPPPDGFNGFGPGATTVPSRETEQFISKISVLHSEEVRLSEIAAQRAAHENVRSFAAQARTSAAAMEQELDHIARGKNVALPTGKSSGDLADEGDKWQKKDGKDFDEDYVQRIIKLKKDAVDTLEDYSKDDDSDPELAAFAQKHLPAARESLQLARNLEKQVD
jgi:predicted outer membrane protein